MGRASVSRFGKRRRNVVQSKNQPHEIYIPSAALRFGSHKCMYVNFALAACFKRLLYANFILLDKRFVG